MYTPRTRIALGMLALGASAACGQSTKPAPPPAPAATATTRPPPPIRDTLYSVVSARWDGRDHVVVIAPEVARREPNGEPIVQLHQQAGHEHPSYPRVADIAPAAGEPLTLVYLDAPACVARVTHALSWAGPMGMAWREALAVDGCPDGAGLAVEGEAPGLRFAPSFNWVEPRPAWARAVAPEPIRSAFGDGEITMVEAGGTVDGIGGTTFVFHGDQLVFWQPRTRARRVLRDGDWLVLELVAWNHGIRLLPIELAPARDALACRRRCSSVDRTCDAQARTDAADAGVDADREPLARCTAAFIECAAACP